MKKKYISAMMAISLFAAQPVWADDAQLVQQLDAEAKQFIMQGDFEAALQKMEAAEILAPDPERMSRIERIRTFIQVRKGIDQISAQPSKASAQAQPAADGQATKETGTAAAQAKKTAAAQPSSQPAQQAAVMDPEQQRIKKILDAWLHDLGASQQLQPDQDLNVLIDTDYQILKKDDAYQVKFDQVKFLDAEGNGLNLGQVVLHFKPIDEQKMQLDIDFLQGMELIEYAEVLSRLQWQQQKITGIWNEQHHLLEYFDLDIGNIRMIFPDAIQLNDRADFTIDRFQYRQALKTKAKQDWQQNNYFNLQNIKVDLFNSQRGESLQFNLGQFQMEADLDGQSIETLAQFLKAQAQLSSSDTAGLMRTIQLGLDLFQSYDFKMQIGPISMDYRDEQEQFSFHLDTVQNHFSVDRAQNKAQFAFQLSFDGLSLKANEVPPQLVPHHFNFNLKLNNLPDPAASIKTLMQDPSQQDQIIAQYVQAIEQNKTSLSLDKMSLMFADFGFNLSANTEFKPSLPPLFNIGTAEINIINLPYLIQLGQQMGLLDEEMQKGLTALSLAAIRIEEEGKPKDIFNLQWDAAGKVLINGKDATALFQ